VKTLLLFFVLGASLVAGSLNITNASSSATIVVRVDWRGNLGATVVGGVNTLITLAPLQNIVVGMPDFYFDSASSPWPVDVLVRYSDAGFSGTAYATNGWTSLPAGRGAEYAMYSSSSYGFLGYTDARNGGDSGPSMPWDTVTKALAAGVGLQVTAFGLWWVLRAVKSGIRVGGEI